MKAANNVKIFFCLLFVKYIPNEGSSQSKLYSVFTKVSQSFTGNTSSFVSETILKKQCNTVDINIKHMMSSYLE